MPVEIEWIAAVACRRRRNRVSRSSCRNIGFSQHPPFAFTDRSFEAQQVEPRLASVTVRV
jgi:hypothetical protein